MAKMIVHSLLRPELTEEQVAEGCRIAREYNVASVTVRPADVDQAVRWMAASGVPVGSVAGFPHGSQTTTAKLYEARDLLRRGALEIDMVLNIGMLLSRLFAFVETELAQMATVCHEAGAILKVIFENAYLTDELKIVACELSTRAGADFVKTSTGFAPTGATLEDLRLMRAHAGPNVQVKAAGGVRSLERALEVRGVGCSRFGATATIAILDAWKARLAGAGA
jgi:deoxyribose-phosphate aldolase